MASCFRLAARGHWVRERRAVRGKHEAARIHLARSIGVRWRSA